MSTLDDFVILNNLDEFKTKLSSQQEYCEEAQREIADLYKQKSEREKKYQKLKNNYNRLKDDFTDLSRKEAVLNEKVRSFELEVATLKAHNDVYRQLMMVPGNNQGPFLTQQVNVNRPVVNNISSRILEQNTAPPPPPPLPPRKSISNSEEVEAIKENSFSMNNVLDELKQKFSQVNEIDS